MGHVDSIRADLNKVRSVPADRHETSILILQFRFFQQLAELLVLAHDSTALYEKLNFTKIFESNLRNNLPILRDLSYLPEEYNNEEFERPKNFGELDRQNRNLMPEYRNLCETVTRRVEFNDENYEYQPPHYHEVYCKSYSLLDRASERTTRSSKQKCAHPGFHCVQRSRTLFLVRRAWDSDCWEPFTKEIAGGCDCMWPVSLLGDIAAHY
ncbi:PREDICTED: uncharacterized protein LOC106788810 [Polistes canadensis]|uniref:uncharacterized protein LOC106788810 n=1 Tax=Polistes canadensis TaxID=91411 RepID=UPI000718B9B3|nr:PREDICTED: uncharacterized protein LOC106788810 [Polistes canadensis]